MVEGAGSFRDTPTPGSIGEEAVKLAEAVQGWLGERTGRAARDVWASATAEADDLHSPECRICPLCRAMRFFTTMNPLVVEHLAEAAVSLGAAMRAMAEEKEPPGPAPTSERGPYDGEA